MKAILWCERRRLLNCGSCRWQQFVRHSVARDSIQVREGIKMSNNIGFFKSLWESVKGQIVQEVPRGIAFCEFQCPRKQCTLELTGTCDIRPEPALVFIRPAAAIDRPEWAKGSSGGVSVAPAHVN
jgi:hypothetical protein